MADFNYTLLVNYLLCFGMGLFIWLLFLKRYLVSWLKVRLPFFSKADVLVTIKNPVGDYFTTGSYNNGMLYYSSKSRPDNKDPKRIISVNQEVYNLAVYRSNGVPCVDVDDVKNCILIWQGESYIAVPGFNSETMAEVVDTALHKPPTDGAIVSAKVFQLMVLGGLIIIGVSIYFIFKKFGMIDNHIKMVYDMVEPIYNNMNVTRTPISGMI